MSEAAALRQTARDMFLHALAETSIESAFERHVSCDGGVLRLGGDLYDMRAFGRIFVVSLGKAAHTMAEALALRTGELQGIIAAPTDPEPMLPGFNYFKGGHPLPNAESVRAAGTILRYLEWLESDALLIFLISGGASAICEMPIDPLISLDDLIATYRVLVHSGAPIAEINAIRKHLSAVKGGRMAQAAQRVQKASLLISDVPGNALDSLASGPTMPDSTTVDDCYRIVEKYNLLPAFPSIVRGIFERGALQETPKASHPAFESSRWVTMLSNDSAVATLAEAAARAGFAVEIDNSCDDWDYADAADYLLKRVRKLREGVSRAALISGGEVTVKVQNGGAGGRNQQFALYCATKIAGENITVLSAGTDGIDGNSPAAGAVADGTTIERAQLAGLSAPEVLKRFDAFPFFEKLSDTIMTGPTGNNVRDLRVLLAW